MISLPVQVKIMPVDKWRGDNMTNQPTDEMRCSFCGGGDNPHPNVPDRRVCICRRVPKDIIRYQDALRLVDKLAAIPSGGEFVAGSRDAMLHDMIYEARALLGNK